MQQFRTPAKIIVAAFLLISFFNLLAPGAIITAVIPLAAPVINRTAGATAKFVIADASENVSIQGSYTSGSGGGTTGAVDLTGATSGLVGTLTVDTNTAAFTSTLPGVNGILPAISGTPGGGNCAQWVTAKTIGDAGAPCGSGSGGNSSGFTAYSGLAGISLTGTIFFPFGGGNPASSTETVVQTKVAAAATLANFGANLSVALGTTLGVNNSVVLTFRDNTSSQALTCTITNPATACVDTTHNFTTVAGDLIDVQAVFTGTISATPVFLMSVQVGATPTGGGTSVIATTFASLPGTCTSGTLYLFTNSPITQALCGASNTYTYFAPGIGAIVPPVLANFTAVNSPTTSTTNGGITITAPSGGSDNYRLLMQNVATAPYTTTACMISGNPNIQFLPIGIGLYDGTKLVIISVYFDNSSGGFGVKTVKLNTLTSFSGYYNTDAYAGGNGFICLRLKDDGTNRIMSWSADNNNFQILTSVSNTDFLTPTKIGLAADSVSSFPSIGTFVHFLTTTP